MKLSVREDSKNYTCTVVKLPTKQKVEGLDNLVKVTVFGNDVLTKKDTDEQDLYLFFPAECTICQEYLSYNNEFRNTNLNVDTTKKGYFEDNGRVKAIKFKSVISTGYLAPISTLIGVLSVAEVENLNEGDEFTDINGINICKKYVVKHVHQNTGQSTESRYNKKLKRFDKLVANQFRFHVDTSHLAKNLHIFHPEDIIVITDKWHGTSAVFANLLINKELKWYEKLAIKLGIPVITTQYDDLYSSRSVIKNRYINKEATAGFYNEDIWAVVHEEIKSKIEPGISLYGEIVGYLPSGKMIQKDYDYSTDKHKFVLYRITYTKPDGNVIEFSWNQIKEYAEKYQIETVKELYFGKLKDFYQGNIENFPDYINSIFPEGNCLYCKNKVPREGEVVRLDGKSSYSAYKNKKKSFLLNESKLLDLGEENIEG